MDGADDELDRRARARVGSSLAGKYRIERLLGVGGMGAVYAATHRNGRRVAIKLLHPELSIRADIRARFVREGQAANAVGHPNAVVVIDDDVGEDGAAFLVMELLDGEAAETLLERSGRRLPARTVMTIAREVCEVLAAAHRAGIVHRDIKPANIFITRDGRVKVLDFGIARVRDAATPSMTHTGMLFGTPAFMAPEQASGQVSLVDGQSDIWAVGATMFTLLSGATVHEGESPQHVAMLAATKPPRSLASVLAQADPNLVAIVDRALELKKADRWPDAGAMKAAIEDACEAIFGDRTPPVLTTGTSDTDVEIVISVGLPKAEGDVNVVGATTAEPVSSTAQTKRRPRRPRWPHTLRIRTLRTTFAAVLSRIRRGRPEPAAVSELKQPVVAAPPEEPHRRRVVAGALLMAVAAILTVALSFPLLRRASPRFGHDIPAAPTGGAEPSSSMVLELDALSAPSATSSSRAPAAAVIATPRGSSTMAGFPLASPAPKPAPRAPRPAVSPSPAIRKPTCTPPYTVNAEGKTIWKTECL